MEHVSIPPKKNSSLSKRQRIFSDNCFRVVCEYLHTDILIRKVRVLSRLHRDKIVYTENAQIMATRSQLILKPINLDSFVKKDNLDFDRFQKGITQLVKLTNGVRIDDDKQRELADAQGFTHIRVL